MSALQYKLWTALGIVLMCVPGGARAQQQGQTQGQSQGQSQEQGQTQGQSQEQSQPQDQAQAPIPAYHSPFASIGGNENLGPEDLAPDTQPLAGVETLSLGIPESRSYWEPSANVTSTAASNGLGANSGWTTFTNLSGGLALHDTSGRSNLSLSYEGGAVVSDDGGTGNGVTQELGLVENLSWERETLSFFEQASYVPETIFGYAGIGALTLPGGNPVVLPPGLGLNGTILTARNDQLYDSSLVQIDIKLSPRSSLTLAGGYSLLDYFGPTLLNTNDTIFQAGYNHLLTRKDTIALQYRFSAFRYEGSSQLINDNTVQLSYARRVTGRLAFQVGAGPEFTFFSMPVLTGPASSGPASSLQLDWSASTSLTYQMERTQLALSYGHGVSGGAGVFTGSVQDTMTGSLSYPFSRTMSAGFATGYARNKALAIPGSLVVNQAYDYWFGDATLSHSLGRTMNLALSYEVQYQNSNFGFCAGPTCGTGLVIHEISVGLGWHTVPLLF